MNKIKYTRSGLHNLLDLIKKLFPEYPIIELAGSLNTPVIVFRKVPKNSLINILGSEHVKTVMPVTDFLLTALPERLSFMKARNNSFIPYYLVGVMTILTSTTPEFVIDYYIQKFKEIEPILKTEEFRHILDRIQESEKMIESTKASKLFIERLTSINLDIDSKEIKLLTLIKNLNI